MKQWLSIYLTRIIRVLRYKKNYNHKNLELYFVVSILDQELYVKHNYEYLIHIDQNQILSTNNKIKKEKNHRRETQTLNVIQLFYIIIRM